MHQTVIFGILATTLSGIGLSLSAKKQFNVQHYSEANEAKQELVAIWQFQCTQHEVTIRGPERSKEGDAKADLKQHRQTDHAGKNVGTVEQLHIRS